MAYELKDLLKGLDDSVVSKVEETIKNNAKELDAKLFIDGDGNHYVPHARFDEVLQQRDSANTTLAEQKEKLDTLAKQVEDNSSAQATISDLQSKLEAQSKLAKISVIENKLNPLITNSIAPATDILGFMDIEQITVDEKGNVTGLEEQLKKVKESKQYLFKQDDDGQGEDPSNKGGKGTGNPGNPNRPGAGAKDPKEVGAFGKQLAQSLAKQGTQQEQTSFFK